MHLKRISRTLVITGALIIWTIKLFIRPQHIWEGATFFLGIAPNLLGAFLIPFAACWFFSSRNFLLARIFHIRSLYDLRIVCLMGFGMLVINEYLQMIPVFGRTFDYYDIAYSSVGLVAAHIVFSRIQQREWQQAR